ncbi:MAG: hypothetical protein HQK53_10185, partial [Oligoflexia bacterium]|nr:hypothetical protein [Oligoflexia bacterium]
NIRSAITTVIVRDKDTIAMGGLMRDKNVETEQKVPLLGDIPVLGWLFKSRSRSTEKANILFFLTPRILTPYEKGVAENTQDLLNRRNAHLRKVYASEADDPFGPTVKSLYKKAERQAEGPLYDPASSARFKDDKGLLENAADDGDEIEDEKNQDNGDNDEDSDGEGSKDKKTALLKNDRKSEIKEIKEIKDDELIEPKVGPSLTNDEGKVENTRLEATVNAGGGMPDYQKIAREAKSGKEAKKEDKEEKKVEKMDGGNNQVGTAVPAASAQRQVL